MRKRVSGWILLACWVLSACGNKDNLPPPPAGSATSRSPNAARAADDAPPQNESAANEASAPVVLPTDIPSETDDDSQESVEQSATSAQPPFKLGGPPPGPPTSGRFREGTHYKRLVPAQPTSAPPDKVEVLEVFWYGCGNCFALDPAIDSWRKSKPPYVDFVRLPAMTNEVMRLQARVFYTAEILGKIDELHALLFREVNVKGNSLDSVEKIGAFFREHGISTDDFQKAFSSSAVEAKLQRADLLNRRLRVSTAPSLVINGKYLTSVEMAGGEQQLFALLAEVADHEHGN